MTDLVTFLLQRVEDDERIAREADPGVWTSSSGNIISETLDGGQFHIAFDYDREYGFGAVDANNSYRGLVACSGASRMRRQTPHHRVASGMAGLDRDRSSQLFRA